VVTQVKVTKAPVLQAPGAGLPWWELLVAKYIVFPRACRRLDWAAAGKLFQTEGAQILTIWNALPAERLGERVLIRRISGIEDSSRHWSAAMTVEHLNIVGTSLRQLIANLRKGVVPDYVARVQDVKPTGEFAPSEVRGEFERLLAEAAASEANEPAIAAGVGPKFPHPWFGPIDAFQWHCLLGVHQGIHRRQMEAIQKSL
jgi:hypothetical protein